MFILVSAAVVATAIIWAGMRIAQALEAARARHSHVAELMAMFAPGIVAGQDDPRRLLAWHRVATTARTLFPEEFAALDRAAGGGFPFDAEAIQRAHARWTADWLAWERTHDAECKLRSAILEHELGNLATTPYGRARLDAIEREKLDRYQQRYEEYTRTARALQALSPQP